MPWSMLLKYIELLLQPLDMPCLLVLVVQEGSQWQHLLVILLILNKYRFILLLINFLFKINPKEWIDEL